MADPQYFQGAYVPTVAVRAVGSNKSEVVPDWLSASYLELVDKITQYTFYTIREEDVGLPDGIAHKVYRNSNWWWLICDYNGIIDTFTDMKVGQRIKIPDLMEVSQLLEKKVKNRATVVDKRGTFVTI